MKNKLKILLLSVLSSTSEDETNCKIANTILEKIDEVRDLNIIELAKICYVSNSSISRFCREIGLRDFNELKELMEISTNQFHYITSSGDICENTMLYIDSVQENIQLIKDNLDLNAIKRIVDDLFKYNKIAAFGLLNAETVALGLQNDLLILNKKITTKISFQQQNDYIKKTNSEDLIIIFSSAGMYFTTNFHKTKFNKNDKPKIILITSNEQMKADDLFDEVLLYPKIKNAVSSSIQLHLIKGIIVQNYVSRMKEENNDFQN